MVEKQTHFIQKTTHHKDEIAKKDVNKTSILYTNLSMVYPTSIKEKCLWIIGSILQITSHVFSSMNRQRFLEITLY